MKCMLRTPALSDAFNAGAPARERHELVYFNVPPFLSAGVYQGYVLHGILIYFHIMKYQHQRVGIMERSMEALFSFSLHHPIARSALRRETEFRATSWGTPSGVTERRFRATISHSDSNILSCPRTALHTQPHVNDPSASVCVWWEWGWTPSVGLRSLPDSFSGNESLPVTVQYIY